MKTKYPIKILKQTLIDTRWGLGDYYMSIMRSSEKLKIERDQEIRDLLKQLIKESKFKAKFAEVRKEDLKEAIDILTKAKNETL